jgi:hypothetical protein
MGPAGGDEDPGARWLVWLRSYVARVEQEVIRGFFDRISGSFRLDGQEMDKSAF